MKKKKKTDDDIMDDIMLEKQKKVKVDNKTAINKQLINPELFDFFSKRRQWK